MNKDALDLLQLLKDFGAKHPGMSCLGQFEETKLTDDITCRDIGISVIQAMCANVIMRVLAIPHEGPILSARSCDDIGKCHTLPELKNYECCDCFAHSYLFTKWFVRDVENGEAILLQWLSWKEDSWNNSSLEDYIDIYEKCQF